MPRLTVPRRSAAFAAVAAATLLAATACGSAGSSNPAAKTAKLSPKDAVKTGFEALENANALTYTIKVDVTKTQLQALEKAGGDTTRNRGDRVGEAIVVGGTIVIQDKAAGSSFAADLAKSCSSAAGQQISVDLNAGDHADLVQLVYTGKTLYGRADAKQIALYEGGDAPQQLQSVLSSPEAAKYPFLAKGAAGDWLSYNVADGLSFLKGADPSAVPSCSTEQGQSASLLGGLEKVYDSDIQSKRDAADPTLGDHIELRGNSRTVATDLVSAIKPDLSSVPGASKLFGDTDTSNVPSKDVIVDAYVKDGALDALKLNITQFLSPAEASAVQNAPIYVEIDIAKDASISAPSDATAVTTSQIIGLFEGMSGDDSSGGTATAIPTTGT